VNGKRREEEVRGKKGSSLTVGRRHVITQSDASPFEMEMVNLEAERKEIPYRYLEARPHPWRKQLWIKGRNMTVWHLVENMLTNRDTPEEAAENCDLPLEVVAEALLYCLDNWDVVQADRDEERRRLVEAGIIKEQQ